MPLSNRFSVYRTSTQVLITGFRPCSRDTTSFSTTIIDDKSGDSTTTYMQLTRAGEHYGELIPIEHKDPRPLSKNKTPGPPTQTD